MIRLREIRSVVADLWRFSRESRKLAFFFLALLLLALGVVVVLGEQSVVLPFIYAIF